MKQDKPHPQRLCDGPNHYGACGKATFFRLVYGEKKAFCSNDCWRAFVYAEFGVKRRAADTPQGGK